MIRFVFVLCAVFSFSLAGSGQTKTPANGKAAAPATNGSALKSSPAFAEIILRRTDLRAEVESLLISYTEDFPKVKDLRFELEALNRELNRLLTVKPEESSKLTLALGKLIVRKAELEADHASLQSKYGDEHPDVKRAKRKIDIFEGAIKAILE